MASKKKKLAIEQDQLLALPLADGSYGLAHVARALDPHSTLYVLHSSRAAQPDDLAVLADPRDAIAVGVTDDLPVSTGDWRIIGKRRLDYARPMPQLEGKWGGYKILPNQLSAYHGLIPWDASVFYRENLLPGVPNPPPEARFKKDFDEVAPGRFVLREEARGRGGTDLPKGAPARRSAATADGPALLEINVLLEQGRQSQTMSALEHAFAAAGIGDVETIETGRNDGYLFVAVESGLEGKQAAEALLEKLECVATVSVGPLEDDEAR